MTSYRFPDGFLWGTGASSTQTEGAAPASDWAAWERDGHAPPSGDGNGFGTRYADDFARLADLGLTHHRLSIEWARIEPRPGQRDTAAVEHYRQILEAARDAGIRPWVCLHHFTLPGWFSIDEGGFGDRHARTYFWPRHIAFVAETFGDLVAGWKPINEPIFYAAGGFLSGTLPPGKRNQADFAAALRDIHLANLEAWRGLRGGGVPVATVQGLCPVFPADDGPETAVATELIDDAMWGCWTGALRDGVLAVPGQPPVDVPDYRDAFDLIGFSYYAAIAVDSAGRWRRYPPEGNPGPMGYVPWPQGLGVVLERLAELLPDKPLLVAECGLGTADDRRRAAYLADCLRITAERIDGGIDVRGFFYWTGIDNYEWGHGFDVAFGLLDRDREARGSADLAARVAAANEVPDE
ncbi:MAG TPA: family 1 glycosylhydrolase [Acidimicrobiales bacterium]|nr:family 1 glycosylhydrolase [Acidimicrobiales bacterium]